MNKNIKPLFTISQFAKLCGVSRQTLIYYDKKQLFSPKYVEQYNQYRYYTLSQIEEFEIIHILKELGMPLQQIKQYIERRNPELWKATLKQQKDKIEEKIKHLEALKGSIDSQIEHMDYVEQVACEEGVRFEQCNKEWMIQRKLRESINDDDFIYEVNSFLKELKEYHIEHDGLIHAHVGPQSIKAQDFTTISHLFVFIKEHTHILPVIEKPKGLYAIINHRGAYEETGKSYRLLIEEIDKRGFEWIGPSYEKTLSYFFFEANEEDYITEISIQIQKKDKLKTNQVD